MQTTNTYLGLLRERGKQRLPLARVYRQLFNKNLYLTAYGKIYRNAGATTKGVTSETVDSMSLQKIENIIGALRSERYQWQPARRTYIAKRNGKKRPLGLPTMFERGRQALAKLAMEPQWEARFETHSYGFRPGRSCHDAIQAIFDAIKHRAKYILDADIAGCFDHISHPALLQKLDTYPTMRQIIKSWLKAGVLTEGKYTPSGNRPYYPKKRGRRR